MIVSESEDSDGEISMIDLTGIMAIADALCVNTSITVIGKGGLNLKNNKLGGEGWGAIFAGVCTSASRKIASIDASGERIGPQGVQLIAKALKASVHASMTECDLHNNRLGVEGWAIVFNALRDSPVSKITKWNLLGEGLGPRIAKPLADYISVTPSLTRLDICGMNFLGEEGKAALQEAIEGRSGFELLL